MDGGVTDTERDIFYCVMTRLDTSNIKRAVKDIDRNAFIIVHNIADIEGGLIKRSKFH